MSKVTYVNEADFESIVLKSDKVTLVDFYADWCGPCKMLGPILDKISLELDSVNIVKVNVDSNQKVAMQYNVRSIPTMLVFKDGKLLETLVGLMPQDKLKAKLASF